MKLHDALLLALIPMLASGCYGNTDSFWNKTAQLTCEGLQECNRTLFEAQYSSMNDCVDTITENGVDSTSTCEYDAEQGRECIKVAKKYAKQCDLNAAELDEISRACEDTHYSCGNGGVGLGYDPMSGQVYISSVDPGE